MSDRDPQADAVTAPVRWRLALLSGTFLLSLLLHGVAVWVLRADLRTDPDAYRSLMLWAIESGGYHQPFSDTPTAFRPPLYVLVLGIASRVVDGSLIVAVPNVIAGALTTTIACYLGFLLGGTRCAILTAAISLTDPLRLRYAALPMTETLCGFLLILALALLIERPNRSDLRRGRIPRRLATAFLLGAILGLGVLCRPTMLIVAAFWAGWSLLRIVVRSRTDLPLASIIGTVLGFAMMLTPWAVRNANTFGVPFVTTTHGGYTLLLGNNPVFYEEVVSAPWGSTWDEDSLFEWQHDLAFEIDIPPSDEIALDRALRDRAVTHIRQHPVLFVRACLLRFARFWSIIPGRPVREGLPVVVVIGLAIWTTLVFGTAIVGVIRSIRLRDANIGPLLLGIAAFSAVHLVYWSNIRMRTPVMPLIAILAGLAFRRRSGAADSTAGARIPDVSGTGSD